MAPRARRSNSPEEFPFLKNLGLMAVKTKGDGNCLFYSFSDQVHGDPSQAREIRQQVVQYMRDHPEDFKPFINVEIGGGSRRNPKRKNVAAATVTLVYTPPTQEQVDAAWEAHLDRMSRNGTYGDHIEIRAFTKAFDVDVKIYNRSNSYYIKAEETGTRPVIHIAHHDWEHYSSVRNIAGPLTGPPNIEVIDAETAGAKTKSDQAPYIADWMIKNVISSLPFLANDATIRKALTDNGGNVDRAVNQLLDEPSSTPSTPDGYLSSQSGNSSIERDVDSDDEDELWGPNKRQNRKVRAIKLMKRRSKGLTPSPLKKCMSANLPDMDEMEVLFI